MSEVTLAIVEGQDAGTEVPLTGTVLVGRDPSADIVVQDSEVSGRHASFAPADGGAVVEDLGSSNGTFVNGERVTGSRPLSAGDRIQLGATVLELRGPAKPEPSPIVAEGAQVTRAKEIPVLPVLVFSDGPLAGSEVSVASQTVLGRDPGVSDVVLDQDDEVSRRHAAFAPAGAGLTVEDLGSTNGTFVDGRRIDGAVALSNGTKVQVGETVIEVRLSPEQVDTSATAPGPVAPPAAAPALPPNGIEVEELVREFGKGHRAVDGVNLQVNPGEIFGFLGPNGAGKSTTVHMLTTLLPPTSGTARVAGYDIVKQGLHVRAAIGVALQAAALDPLLNSWEHMELQTALQGLPKAQRKPRAEELLHRVGLTDAAERAVGGYSGGMKRRLDLALALVHWPRVLFLDEPTTGLWEEVAGLARDEGATVFLTTQYLEEADLLADRVAIIDHGEIVANDTPANLKQEIGRPTVEAIPLDNSDWAAISEVLERFGDLSTAANKGVAVRLARGVEGLVEIVRALDSQGLEVANLELRAPTLDDVFLAKTGHSLEGAAEEAAEEGGGEVAEALSAATPGL